MANICTTYLRIYGDGENFNRLIEELDRLCINKDGLFSKEVWIGELAEVMGMDTEKTYLRGSITCYDSKEAHGGGSFSIDIDSAWCPPFDFMRRIEEFYEGVGVSFLAEEPGFDIYETNDPEYFASMRFKADVYDVEQEYFDTCEDAEEFVKSCGVSLENEDSYSITELELCDLYGEIIND